MPNFNAGRIQKLRKTDGTDQYINFGSAHVNISKSTDSFFFANNEQMLERIDDVIFSSYWFNYLSVSTLSIQNESITLPSRTAVFSGGDKKSDPIPQPYFGIAEYYLGSHGKDYVPAFAAFDTVRNKPFGGVQAISYGTSFRLISFAMTTSRIYVRESYGVGATNLPSETLSLSFLIFDQGLETTTSYTDDPLLITQNKVVFGSGKFNTDFNYVYSDPYSNYRINEQGGLRNMHRTSLPWYATLEIVNDGSVVTSVTGSTPAFAPLREDFEYPSITGKTSGVALP